MLAGDGSRGLEQLLAGHHLAHHEVAQELRQVLRDLLGPELVAERLLVAGVISRVDALGLRIAQRYVAMAIEAVTQQPVTSR